MSKKPRYKIETIPRMRRLVFDAGIMGRNRHSIHSLIEVDGAPAARFVQCYRELLESGYGLE